MTNTIKKAVLGLIAGAAIAVNANAANPADLTSNNRECPVQFYKVLGSNSSNWACGIVPLGKDKKTSLCGLALQTSKGETLLEGVIANHTNLGKGIGLDSSLDVSKFGNYDIGTKLTLDLNNKYGGICAVVPINKTEDTQMGARANYKGLEIYTTTPVKELNLTCGLSKGTRIGKLEASLNPLTNNAELRISKAYETKKGTIIPELRVSGAGKISNVALALAYIPGGKQNDKYKQNKKP